jgi:hypothetical protein
MKAFSINITFIKRLFNLSGDPRSEQEIRKKKQNSVFFQHGLDRNAGLTKLNELLLKLYGKEYDETTNMWSEHLVLFASISESDIKISKILEIGTFDGETTKILSYLFPESEILTIDLPRVALGEIEMYKYKTGDPEFESLRNLNLTQSKNVQFKEMNSLQLLNSSTKFDLIWIDGDHSYPIAAIDIANSLRLLTLRGMAICDDVYMDSSKKNTPGRSNCSYETLCCLSEAKLICYSLIRKRVGIDFNSANSNEKFLGIIKKLT